MKVGVLCEFSGVVRDAFRRLGHDAVSCDLLPTEAPGPHIQGDCFDYDWSGYDLLICHPPCTYLCNSGVRWLHSQPGRWEKMVEAAKFFRRMLELPVPRIVVENPVMHGYARSIVGRGPDQVIQPWQHGHRQMKATCLWLRGVSPLRPSNVVGPPPTDPHERRAWQGVHRASPGPNRWKLRSVTFQGIADAMASQWGGPVHAQGVAS